MKTKRSKVAVKSIIVVTVMQILSLAYSLISKRFFLDSFSLSAYGVIDLFSSFFSSLMLLEMGFGTILIYNLYKPLAVGNREEVIKQLSVFKTIYSFLIVIVLVVSLTLAPFIYAIFNISINDIFLVYEVYFCNIVSIVVKYWTLNKISILNAGQYKYIEYWITIIIDFLSFIGKVIAVKYFENIYLYVFSLLASPIFIYIVETIWVNKRYKLKSINFAALEDIMHSNVLGQCKKYIYATIHQLIFLSMDNIIISVMISTDAVAYVSNYYQLINTASQFIIMVMSSFRGIIADYRNNNEDIGGYYSVFNIVASLNFIFVSLMAVGFYVLIDDFISLWLGDSYVISTSIFVCLLLIRVIECIFEPVQSIFVIEGHIFKERLPLILSALTNFILTILFIKQFGLVGAYIATIIALFIKWFGKFYYILKDTFVSYKGGIVFRYICYFGAVFIEMILIKGIADKLVPEIDNFLFLISKGIIVVVISLAINGCIIFFDRDTREYIAKNVLISFRSIKSDGSAEL